MKKFYRILSLVLVSAAVLSACTKEDPWTPGKPAGQNDIYFSGDNANTVVLGLSDTSFDIVLERSTTSGSVTVPVSFWVSTPGVASAEPTVTFADGSSTATLKITLANMDPFVNYTAKATIPEEYTQPYKDRGLYPECGFVFYKEDYKPFAEGIWYDDFWTGEYTEQTLEYSEMLDTYRVVDPWGTGSQYGFTFQWDGGDNFKLPAAKFDTGLYHSSYGYIQGQLKAGDTEYDPVEKAIYFGITWTVSAGSFGVYYNVFYFAED